MMSTAVLNSRSKASWLLRLLILCAFLVPPLAFAQSALAATASDNFNRANGSLGANWTDISEGGLAISSQAAAGTAASANSGDIWNAGTFTGNQYSQVEVTSTQLTGGQWIGSVVRAQSGGQTAYVGIYYWNNGSQVLMLFKRNGGNWTQLGSTYHCGAARRGNPAAADGHRLHDLLPGERRSAGISHRHQHHRRRAGHHGLRHRAGRQLVRRGCRCHLLGRRAPFPG